MFPMLTDTPLSQPQVIAATRLMLTVAHVDGAKTAEEEALIRTFYEGCVEAGDGWPAFDALRAGDVAAGVFADPGQRDTVLAFCLMVAYADGSLSADEERAVRDIAAKLGADSQCVDRLLDLVKDAMLARLANLPDAASVARVAKELG